MLNYTPQSSREARRIPRGRSLPKFIFKIAEGRSTLGMLPWSAIRGGQSSDKEERGQRWIDQGVVDARVVINAAATLRAKKLGTGRWREPKTKHSSSRYIYRVGGCLGISSTRSNYNLAHESFLTRGRGWNVAKLDLTKSGLASWWTMDSTFGSSLAVRSMHYSWSKYHSRSVCLYFSPIDFSQSLQEFKSPALKIC